MKKNIIILLTFSVLIIFNGCQRNSGCQAISPENSSAQVAQQETKTKDSTPNQTSSKNTDVQVGNTNNNQKNSAEAAANYSDINAFWKYFRTLLINKNIPELKKFTQFPLESRGLMDTDPIIKFNEDKFENLITTYLNQPSGLEINQSNLEYIKKHDTLNSNDLQTVKDGSARIGDMKFKLVNNVWKLTFVYLDEDSYKNLGVNIKK